MKIIKEDLIKFYELLHHYNKLSPNIAVIGDKKTFKKKVKLIIDSKKPIRVSVNNECRKYRLFFANDVEENYIQVEVISDLTGYFFKKFI